ncbi:hypothetical protein LK492_19620, partial [Phocaeicola vulgatus]|nr:hypothetical protein [Phocaeicola vulgatus]
SNRTKPFVPPIWNNLFHCGEPFVPNGGTHYSTVNYAAKSNHCIALKTGHTTHDSIHIDMIQTSCDR